MNGKIRLSVEIVVWVAILFSLVSWIYLLANDPIWHKVTQQRISATSTEMYAINDSSN